MRRFKALTAAFTCSAVAAAATGAAHAGPSIQTWDFYNCSGPGGTPASFSATRQGGVGAMLSTSRTGARRSSSCSRTTRISASTTTR
jgi:hypothetical protein